MRGISVTTRWSPSRIAVLRTATRATAVSASIHPLPILSTAVLLLIVMMVTAAFASPHHQGLALDFPRAFSAVLQPAADRDDVIKVSIARDGNVYFRNAQIVLNELPERIRTAVQGGAERKVYLAVDGRARYVDVAPVLDQIRVAGITRVCFLAEKIPLR